MEKLNDLLREYAQAIRRDDGTAFMHADAIRNLFERVKLALPVLQTTERDVLRTALRDAFNAGGRCTKERIPLTAGVYAESRVDKLLAEIERIERTAKDQ